MICVVSVLNKRVSIPVDTSSSVLFFFLHGLMFLASHSSSIRAKEVLSDPVTTRSDNKGAEKVSAVKFDFLQ